MDGGPLVIAFPVYPRTAAGGLSRSWVLGAAVSMIDAEGVAVLTVHRLGDALGVQAMALYHYVRGRDELVEAVIAAVAAGIQLPSGADPSGGWRGFLRQVADDVQQVALRHPGVLSLLVTYPPAHRWTRAPLTDPQTALRFVATLEAMGVPAAAAGRTYRAFTSFLTGQLSLDALTSVADETTCARSPLPAGPVCSARPKWAPEAAEPSNKDVAGQLIDRRFVVEEFTTALAALTDQLSRQFHLGFPAP